MKESSEIIVEVLESSVSIGEIIDRVKTADSGCVVTYIGLIRDNNNGKPVLSVEYRDVGGKAKDVLQQIAGEILSRWPVKRVAIVHRIGLLNVGDVNFFVAVAASHRHEGFQACQYAVDQFKTRLPTQKVEMYNPELF